ncbi:hypothetical protein BGX34_004695 [Mortierella sp. NVP85]|nr:hypothetical protein BGX34_004695 [Mortierella sp. NVP85]
MRKRLAHADHPLHLPSPETDRYQHHLALQLEYYKQLQIMHCQRVRDIELLHLQQQRLHHPQSLQNVKRFQLAQRMLQMQQLFHAQQIQKIQYLQKINRLQRPAPAEAEHSAPPRLDHVSEEDLAKLEIDPNTIHLPVRPASRPRVELQEILGSASRHLPSARQCRVQELSRIVLPSPDQIRKLRHQRLKCQARLRQAAMKVKAPLHQPDTTPDVASGRMCPEAEPASPSSPSSSTSSLTLPSSSPPSREAQVRKQVQTTVWTSSTTSVLTRSKADLQYKSQLRHSMALQQHMIQDHTHRYRIFQAFCLLQRAREAQALDELQTQQRRQLQTLAWVEALRNSKELEIPQ